MSEKTIQNCTTCVYSKKIHDKPVNGHKVECMPLDYYGTQATRMLPRIAESFECSRFKLSKKKLDALLEQQKEAEKERKRKRNGGGA